VRIALIQPGLGVRDGKRQKALACLRPTALAVLAGATPADVEVHAFDDRFEEPPYGQQWDLVALSVGTFQARRAYEITARFRRGGVPVVLGGFHPSQCPDEAGLVADAVAIGEAEVLWPQIVEDARKGGLQRVYRQRGRADLAATRPDVSIFSNKKYAPVNVIQFGRGCHHNCDFCSVRAFYPEGLRHRPVRDVVEELERASERWTFFSDDNLCGHPSRAKTMLREIAPLKKRWTAQTSLDFVDDPELLELMVKAGCQTVIIGLESLNPGTIDQMKKGWADAGEYARKLKIVRDRGIMVYATFVFGYDADDPGIFERTYQFAMEQKFFLLNFNHLNPFPGTPLYHRLEAEGRLLLDRWWINPEYRFGNSVYEPRGMTAQELTEGAFAIRSKVHGYPAMLRRFLDRKTNAASLANALTFALVNIGSRQDILSKHGRPLGLEEELPDGLRGVFAQ
jgi:radical SAM superfamily enzyme YgiQ (UPF0313 family)